MGIYLLERREKMLTLQKTTIELEFPVMYYIAKERLAVPIQYTEKISGSMQDLKTLIKQDQMSKEVCPKQVNLDKENITVSYDMSNN